MYRTIHHSMLWTIGLYAGLLCLRLLALVLGCAYISALGLVMCGHWPLAMMILVIGHTLYGSLRWLLFGRR